MKEVGSPLKLKIDDQIVKTENQEALERIITPVEKDDEDYSQDQLLIQVSERDGEINMFGDQSIADSPINVNYLLDQVQPETE